MQRTLRGLLEPSPEQATRLAETLAQFTSAFNHAVRIGWDKGITNATKLHYAAYYPVKHAHPALVSDLVNQVRVKAAEALRSARTRQRCGLPVSCPHSAACPPRYNHHTFKVDWESRTVRLSTTGGRQTIRFRLPACYERYAGGDTDTADLLFRTGRWWLHVVVSMPAPEIAPGEAVAGVDLGLARPAVTSTARFLGKRHWRNVEARTFRLKWSLQSRGTKSAKRHLGRLRGRQRRFRRDCDHVLSKGVVQGTPAGGTIALENLKHIRSRVRMRHGPQSRRLHSWSFAQLRSFIEYKAEERGCTVAGVDPRHTSQACSRCGHTARNNRRSRARFKCRSCGFELHADLNGARNIAAKYLASLGIPGAGGLPVNQPFVGGLCLHGSTHKPPALAGGH